jgi:hypothetical protein
MVSATKTTPVVNPCLAVLRHSVAAQVEFESKNGKQFIKLHLTLQFYRYAMVIMTKCVKPLRHLATSSTKSSRSTNQNAPRISTESHQVSEWFRALSHNDLSTC